MIEFGRFLLVCLALDAGASASADELRSGADFHPYYPGLVLPPCRESDGAAQLRCRSQGQAESGELTEYNVIHGPQPAAHAPYAHVFSWQNR